VSTETTEVSQAKEQPAGVSWSRINLAAIRLDLAVAAILILQRMLFSLNTDVIVLTEILVLSFLFSWRFAVGEVSSRFVMHGALLGVMAVVFRLVFVWVLMPGLSPTTLRFILPSAMTILGCIAGGRFAARL